MRTRNVAGALVLCLLLGAANCVGGQTSTTSSPAAATPSTGTQIGQMVSDAVNTAFPIIGKIMDLFASKKSASKDQVSQAVNTAQTNYMKAAKEKVQPVATVSKELGVVQAFGSAGVSASQNLDTINRLLAENTPDYGQVDTEWTVAKNYLAGVLTMKPADIQSVRSTTIQARIFDLQRAHKDLMVRIDANIAAAQKKSASFFKPELQGQITAMSGLLNGFDTLGAVELSMLQADIDDLAKWANSPAGPLEFTPKKPNSRLLKIIDDATARASAAARKQ